MERIIDASLVTTPEFFTVYECEDPEEQRLLVRLFKRFFFRTIERKYGYLKPSREENPEISAFLLCSELELTPKVLPYFGVITSFKSDAMVSWVQFVKIMIVFVFRKDIK